MAQIDDFLNKTYQAATEICSAYGLPVLFALSQSALETGWGKSAPGNMYFGIKAGSSWAGKTQTLSTKEWDGAKFITINAKFRAYDSVRDSFEDWAKLLTQNARYKDALKYPNDLKRFTEEIKKGGYATDPQYVSKILNVAETIKKKQPH